MRIKDVLESQGIELEKYTVGSHQAFCPNCRTDTETQKKLFVKITDSKIEWKCFNPNCKDDDGAPFNGSMELSADEPEQQKEAPLPPQQKLPAKAMLFLDRMGVGEAKAIQYGVTYYEEGNPAPEASERFLVPFTKYKKKYDTLIIPTNGTVPKFHKNNSPIFYGLDSLTEGSDVIVVSSVWEKMLLDSLNFDGVIAIPTTSTSSEDMAYIASAETWFNAAKNVTLCIADIPEREAIEKELSRRIGREKTYRVSFTKKDSLIELMKRKEESMVQHIINNAEAYPIKGLYEIKDFSASLEDYFVNGMSAGLSTGLSNLDQYFTLVTSRLTGVTGIPTHGKSEFVDQLLVNASKLHGWKNVVFSPEHEKEIHVTKLVEKYLQQTTNPKAKDRVSFETFQMATEWVQDHFKFIVSDDVDDNTAPTVDWILELVRIAVLRYGVKGVVIDPYNEIEHQRPAHLTEHEYVSKFLSKLKRFTRIYDVAMFLVAHPTKLKEDEKTKKMKVPSLYDIAGSSNFANKLDNGIVVYRGETNVEIHIKKIKHKHEGQKGTAKLFHKFATGSYIVPQSEEIYTSQDGEQCRYSLGSGQDDTPKPTKKPKDIKDVNPFA